MSRFCFNPFWSILKLMLELYVCLMDKDRKGIWYLGLQFPTSSGSASPSLNSSTGVNAAEFSSSSEARESCRLVWDCDRETFSGIQILNFIYRELINPLYSCSIHCCPVEMIQERGRLCALTGLHIPRKNMCGWCLPRCWDLSGP